MPAPQDIERAAQRAADRVRALLVEMLAAGELGEVAVIVGYSVLEPEKRKRERSQTIRVARGGHVAIKVTE